MMFTRCLSLTSSSIATIAVVLALMGALCLHTEAPNRAGYHHWKFADLHSREYLLFQASYRTIYGTLLELSSKLYGSQ